MTSSNPAFSQDMFAGYDQVYGAPRTRSTVTTVQGTRRQDVPAAGHPVVHGALVVERGRPAARSRSAVLPISAIGGFIVAMITIFKPTAAPVTAPIYAALEGVFLGAISQIYRA